MKTSETGNREPGTGNREWKMRRGGNIAERLLQFAVVILKLVKTFPNDIAGRHVAGQLLRAATSSGANYEEARAAESRADFIHKVGVSGKEMGESIYWLELVARSGWTRDLASVIGEARELAAILGASFRTAKARSL